MQNVPKGDFYLGKPQVDLTGKVFSQMTVVGYYGSRTDNWLSYWICQCSCGKEKIVAYNALVSKRTLSCGCKTRTSKNGHASWKGYGSISGQFWGNIVRNAKRQDKGMSLSIKDAWELYLKQNGTCNLSGLPIDFGDGYRRNITASLDRIDSGRGYHIDNVQWVHKDINKIKTDISQSRFIELCQYVSQHNEQDSPKSM